MIDFTLTDDQIALQEMAREFAEKEMRPKASEYDQGHEFPEDVMRKAFEVGFLSCTIPSEYGGGGLGELETAIISEELSWGCAGMYTTMMANSLAFTPIFLFGTEDQKKEFLTPFTREMRFASYCLTEREGKQRQPSYPPVLHWISIQQVLKPWLHQRYIYLKPFPHLFPHVLNTCTERPLPFWHRDQ